MTSEDTSSDEQQASRSSQPVTRVFAKAGLYNVIFIISNVAALVRAHIYKFSF